MRKLMLKLKKIREIGLINLIKIFFSKFYKKSIIYKRESIYVINDSIEDFYITDINENILANLSEYEKEIISQRKYDIFLNRLKNNKIRGYFIKKNMSENIAGYFWNYSGIIEETSTGYSKILDNNSIYLFDFYIFEKYRGQGITNNIFLFLNDKNDYYAIVDKMNIKSTNMFKKNGFTEIGYYITVWLFKKRKILVERWREE